MQSKNSILIDDLTQLQQNQRNKGTRLRHFDNESFQEFQFRNLQHCRLDLIDAMILLYRQSANIPILDRLVSNPTKYSTCLLTYCPQIAKLEQDRCTISHRQCSSQSPLLALFLAKTTGKQVHLVIADKSLLAAGHLLADPSQIDKLSFIRQQIIKQGVILHPISHWSRKPLPLNKGDLLIFDAFGLNPIDYSPLLIQTCQAQLHLEQTYIYHSNLQDQEIENLLSLTNFNDYVPLKIWPQHPLHSIVGKQEEALLQKLIQFLSQDSNHPQRQDVVIFCPSEIYLRELQQQLSKAKLKDHVYVVTKPNQSGLSDKKGKIFVVNGTRQLQKWNYDYSNVVLVIDYSKDVKFKFDYDQQTYVSISEICNQVEKGKRMAYVAVNRSGQYVCLQSPILPNCHYANDAKEISAYLLKMIDFGLSTLIDRTNERIIACLNLMKQLHILTEQNGQLHVVDKRVLEAAIKGIPPIESNLIYRILDKQGQSKQEKERASNLLVMALLIWHSEGNLRQSYNQHVNSHMKPKDIWRRSGYLESCLQILTKSEIIEFRRKNSFSKSQSFRHKTSKVSESDLFGGLFAEEYIKKSFDDMDISDLIRHFGVNSDVLMQLKDEVDHYRQQLDIEQINIMLQPSDLHGVINQLLPFFGKTVAVYSGSRRTGFIMSDNQKSILPNKQCLISQLNERPEFLFVLRQCENEGIRQILMCNSITPEQYIGLSGKLLSRHSESPNETQIEFHGVATSTFQELWKDNGEQIIRFEKEHDCMIEPNQEMALIRILCSKELAEEVRVDFQAVLTRIKQELLQSTKLVHYLGNTSLVLEAGGTVRQIVRPECINKCLLQNLDLSVTTDDLEELFDELFVLKGMEIIEPQKGELSKSAIIHFHSPNDYDKFRKFFNECSYYDRLLQVKPLKGSDLHAKVRNKQYIEFKWSVWQSHGKGFVEFLDNTVAQKAKNDLSTKELDGAKIKVTLDGCQLIIEGMNGTTDELYLQEAMRAYGDMKEVQILKTPLKQTEGERSKLQQLIKNVLKLNNNADFAIGTIDKLRNGLRTCKVQFANVNEMMVVVELNNTIGQLGEGRLHSYTWFEIPLLIPHGWMFLYESMLKECIEEDSNPPITYMQEDEDNRMYLVLKGKKKDELNFFHQKLTLRLNGQYIYLTEYQKSIVLTDIGVANLLDLQEKYQAKFRVRGGLYVIVVVKYLQEIMREIKQCLEQHFFYSVSLNRKAYKFFKANPDKLSEVGTNFDLKLVEIEADSMTVLLEGSAVNVQKAFHYLIHFVESLTVPEEDMMNINVCGVCCEEISRSYRLQSCGHKFCRECLILAINSALGDTNQFPLRCPQCRVEIAIVDLEWLLERMQWLKLQTVAVNKYVGLHASAMNFCFKPGCKQIMLHKIQEENITSITCDACLSVFCPKCKKNYHPNNTCEEQAAKANDKATEQYMKKAGIRNCANPDCRVTVVRVSGCKNVTCTQCNTSMCFKCDPEKMVPYSNHDDCYQHLDSVHGGQEFICINLGRQYQNLVRLRSLSHHCANFKCYKLIIGLYY